MSTFFRGEERRGGTGEERNLGTRFSTQTPREIPYSHLKIKKGRKKGNENDKAFHSKAFQKWNVFFLSLSLSLPAISLPTFFARFVRQQARDLRTKDSICRPIRGIDFFEEIEKERERRRELQGMKFRRVKLKPVTISPRSDDQPCRLLHFISVTWMAIETRPCK